MSAAARIDELKKRYEENPRRFFAPLANEYRKAGDLDAAIALCQEHLADQPGNMNGHVVYGQALFEAARFDEARATFETALALDPENLIALRHLGDMARTTGDGQKAREWYARVLDADPRNEEILGFLREVDLALAADASSTPEAATLDEVPAVAAAPITPMESKPSAAPTLTREALGEAKTLEMRPVTPRFSPATPVVPFSEPVPPSRQSTGLMDLSIDLGTPVESEFGAGIAPAMPPAAPSKPPKPKDAINEAFAESFGVLYEESPSGPALVPPSAPSVPPEMESLPEFSVESAPLSEKPAALPSEPANEFSVEAAPDFSFESSSRSFSGPLLDAEEAVHPFPDLAAESPSELSAELVGEPLSDPAAAAASSDPVADYLFGDSLADLRSAEVEGASERGVEAAVPSGATPAAGSERVEAVGGTPQAFITETMAELYLQQGFRDEALDVYRQLSAQHPDDQSLRDRVRHLERGDRTSLSLDAVPSEISAAPEEPVGAPEGFAPIGAMLEPATPAVGTPVTGTRVTGTRVTGTRVTGTPSAGTPVSGTPLTAMSVAGAFSATARNFFATLSLRRALRSDGTPPIGIEAVIEAPASTVASPFVAGGTLDTMFGGPVGEADEHLALSIASMAEAIEVPVPTVKGQPTKPADTEFSLDKVFRESTPRSSTIVSRRSQKLRFDQFFTPSDDVSAVSPPPPSGDPGGPADLEQFSSWLQGLKSK
jgi:tetratricopeptide (TPR) repeat protein